MATQNDYRPFMPLLMLAAAVAIWFGFTTMQLIQERDELRVAGENQLSRIENAQRLRANVQSLNAQLQALRDRGNRNAIEILEQLEKQGIDLSRLVGGNAATAAPQPPTE